MTDQAGDVTTGARRPSLDGPRPARAEERAALLAMVNYVFRTSRGLAPSIDADWAHVYTPENLAQVNVVCDPTRAADDGVADPARAGVAQVVASTGVWATEVVLGEHRLRVGGINCVGTLPEYRRHGLGAQVMAAAHETMRRLGCQVGLLSTGITNWYRRLGWENAGMSCIYALNRGNVALLPQLRAPLRVRTVAIGGEEFDACAEAVVELRRAARWGAVRTVEQWRQLALARHVDRLLLAEVRDAQGDEGLGAAGGSAVAYVLLRGSEVYEWAGATGDVLGLLRAAFELLDDPALSTSQRASNGDAPSLRALEVLAPASDVVAHDAAGQDMAGPQRLAAWFDARGFPATQEYLGMLYVVDPQGVLDAFGVEDVAVRVQGEGAQAHFTVEVAGKTLTLDRGQLTKLLFGPERVLGVEDGPLPLPFWQWPLEHV